MVAFCYPSMYKKPLYGCSGVDNCLGLRLGLGLRLDLRLDLSLGLYLRYI